MSDKYAIAGTVALGTFVVGMLGLIGWSLATYEPDAEVSRRSETFMLLGIDPPKHFYVDLKDARGDVRNHVYVSKHCNSWKALAIGQTLVLDVVTYRRPERHGGRTYEKIQTGNNAVCPKA